MCDREASSNSTSKDVSYNHDSQMTKRCHLQIKNGFSSNPFLRAHCRHISLYLICGFDSEYISMIANKEINPGCASPAVYFNGTSPH